MVDTENSIYISDKARTKVDQLMQDAELSASDGYFLRVGVVGLSLIHI